MPEIYDASGGVVKTVHVEGKTVTFGYSQDVSPIIENNKHLASLDDGYTSRDKWRRRVASVPYGVLFKWLQDDGITQLRFMRMTRLERAAWLRRKIYDPDNFFVLTAPHKRT